MTIQEAIYCMESYLPDKANHCVNCPYYGSIEVDKNVFVCKSSEAHRLAVEALQAYLNKSVT